MSVAIMEGRREHFGWIFLWISLGCVSFGLSSVVNSGVVFEGWGDLAFSSQTHTLGLVLDTSNISRQLDKLSKIVLTTGTVASEQTDTLTSYFFS